MLKVTVRELGGLDLLHQRPELLPEPGELLRLAEKAFRAAIQMLPLDPRHLHDRKRAAFDAETVGQVEELGAVRGTILLQVLGDGGVALGVVRDRPEKAAHRPDVLAFRRLVDHGVPARGRLGHAEAVLVDLRPLQLGIVEGALRGLKGLVVVGQVGPGGHRASPRPCPARPAG